MNSSLATRHLGVAAFFVVVAIFCDGCKRNTPPPSVYKPVDSILLIRPLQYPPSVPEGTKEIRIRQVFEIKDATVIRLICDAMNRDFEHPSSIAMRVTELPPIYMAVVNSDGSVDVYPMYGSAQGEIHYFRDKMSSEDRTGYHAHAIDQLLNGDQVKTASVPITYEQAKKISPSVATYLGIKQISGTGDDYPVHPASQSTMQPTTQPKNENGGGEKNNGCGPSSDVEAALKYLRKTPCVFVSDGASDYCVEIPKSSPLMHLMNAEGREWLVRYLDDVTASATVLRGNAELNVPFGYLCLDLLLQMAEDDSMVFTNTAGDDVPWCGTDDDFFYPPDILTKSNGIVKMTAVRKNWSNAIRQGRIRFKTFVDGSNSSRAKSQPTNRSTTLPCQSKK